MTKGKGIMQNSFSSQTYLEIGNRTYKFQDIGVLPGILYAEVGKKGLIYKLKSDDEFFALKILKPEFNNEEVRKSTEQIGKYKSIKGLKVADRILILPETHKTLLSSFPSLKHAILMPWIEGITWLEITTRKISISKNDCFEMASSLIKVLINLENLQLAHCDISGDNVIFSNNLREVELLDLDDMCGPGFIRPQFIPAGTNGYVPRWVINNGLWDTRADRIAGSIIISEILTWQFEDVRNSAVGETYFDSDEFGIETTRYQTLLKYLKFLGQDLAPLFQKVWFATNIGDCPKIQEWEKIIGELK